MLLTDLIELFKRGLAQYAFMMWSKIPTVKRMSSLLSFERSPFSGNLYEAPPEDFSKFTDLNIAHMQAMCILINTSEYVLETIGALYSTPSIQAIFPKTNPFEITCSQFETVLHASLSGMISLIASKLKLTFYTLDWDIDMVGDASNWIQDVENSLREYTNVCRDYLTATYMNYFFTQVAASLSSRIVQGIFKIRKISPFGIQQMLLDVSTIKTFLFSLNDSASFTRYARSEFSKIEGMLKTIAAPPSSLVATYTAVLQQTSLTELCKLVDLKKVTPQERNSIVESYRLLTKSTEATPQAPEVDSLYGVIMNSNEMENNPASLMLKNFFN